MEWFIALLAVVVVGIAAVAASGRLGQFGQSSHDRPELILPEGDLSAEDVRRIRLAVVPRGYAMDQVDEVLSRLVGQLQSGETYAELAETGIIGEEELTGKAR
ncbi:MAG: DivIVA domain-containing protein [Propionibacteriaceae bacterium]|jgi:DivIVA domain-containing protein|nr:DivIVA domain-containing protein [Propionibacteriaceae bacterium]